VDASFIGACIGGMLYSPKDRKNGMIRARREKLTFFMCKVEYIYG